MEPEKKTPEEEKKPAPAAEQKDEPREDTGNKQTNRIKMRFERNMVEVTRFELATSASRTQRSTKLSHTSILSLFFKREEYSINILRRKCCGTAS